MARIVQFQTNFSVGELDPLLKARTDLEQYQNALETAKNVLVQPQGGVRRRNGLKFIHDFGASFTDFKLIPFEYSSTDSYMLVFVNLRMYVFKDGVLQTNINGSGNDYATTTITAAMLDELNYTQAVDTLIVVHEDLEPQRIVRNSDTSWTVGALPISFIPQYAYAVDFHNPTFTITPSDISGNITITASSVTTDNGIAQAGGADTITLKAATSYSSDDEPNGMFIEITSGTGSGQTRHVEDYVASTKVLTVYPAWDTAPDATSHYEIKAFKPAAVGEYLNVLSGFGRARYTEYVSDTEMKAYVEVPFFDTDPIASGDWESEHGWEDTWSATRGWPRSATFHEGRLYFGGAKSRTNTIWGSRVIDYYNFNPGSALDDDAVEATINTNQLNIITHMFSGPELQIFTTGGEFVVGQSANSPITPSTLLVKPQTRLGSKTGVPIEDLNGATIFVQRQGKSIVSFQFRDTVAAYQTQALSVLSSHLVRQPVDLAVRRATSTDETDRLFLVNNDGTMAVYSILAAQNVIAPSEFVTDGSFIACAVEIDKAFVIVKRTVNGTDKYYLELFSEDLTTDSAKSGGAAASVTMDHLEAKEVRVIRDGVIEPAQTVPASPYTVTFETASTSSYEVGLDFDVEIKTMPAEPRLAQGTIQGTKKRILQIDAIVYETQNMNINGKEVAFRQFGVGVLDTAVQAFTGTKTVSGVLGFTSTGQITITQSAPQKLTLLGLEYRMSVGN
jgi:hypothetical protein